MTERAIFDILISIFMANLDTHIHTWVEWDSLQWETPSPITRISCRVRTLSPTVCDWTCLDCREERNRHRESWISKRERAWIGNNGGDPDESMPDFENLYEQHLAKITKAKNAIIEARKYTLSQSHQIEEIVRERLEYFQMLASHDPINIPPSFTEARH